VRRISSARGKGKGIYFERGKVLFLYFRRILSLWSWVGGAAPGIREEEFFRGNFPLVEKKKSP